MVHRVKIISALSVKRFWCFSITFLNLFGFTETMAKDKITMPTSTAGITRYFDDYKSKVEIKPGIVIVICIVVIVAAMLAHAYF